MTEKRAYGPIVVVPSTLTLGMTLTVGDLISGNWAVLDSSDVAFPTVSAGSYRLSDLSALISTKLQTWVTAALAADPHGDWGTKGTMTVTLTFSPATTAGGSLFSLQIAWTGNPTFAGAPAFFLDDDDGCRLENATGAYSALGLVYETATGSTNRLASGLDTATITWSGLWQPRGIFVLLRSEADEGNVEHTGGRRSVHYLGDGAVRTFKTGYARQTRRIRLLDLEESIAGRGEVLGRVASSSSLDSDRVTVNLEAASTTSLSGISNLYYNSDAGALTGYWVRVPATPFPWFARLRSASSSSVVLVEKVPTGLTVTPGAVLTIVSEVHALFYESIRIGTLSVHPVKDSDGSIKWVSEEYAVLGGEEPEFAPSRLSAGAPLYSYTLELLKAEKAGLTLA